MDKKLEELRKTVLKYRTELAKDKAAANYSFNNGCYYRATELGKNKATATYYGLTRGTLMFQSLPEKGMKITLFKLIDLTEQGIADASKGNVKFYDLAIPDGFIPKEMIPDCLTAVLKAEGNSLALVPDGSFCWDDVALEWQPVEKSAIAEFCL